MRNALATSLEDKTSVTSPRTAISWPRKDRGSPKNLSLPPGGPGSSTRSPGARRALREHDHVTLFEMGAHPFLTLTLFIAMFERDHGRLEYQKAYGEAMEHITLPYPDIAT